MNFGGVMETVVTSHEFSLEKAREEAMPTKPSSSLSSR